MNRLALIAALCFSSSALATQDECSEMLDTHIETLQFAVQQAGPSASKKKMAKKHISEIRQKRNQETDCDIYKNIDLLELSQ